jgi:hypothetical protein
LGLERGITFKDHARLEVVPWIKVHLFGTNLVSTATMHRSPSNILEILFIKHMWIFNLMTLTAVAYFLAQGAGEKIIAPASIAA